MTIDHFTRLYIDFSHIVTLHGGTTLTLAYIQQTFWIMKPRQTVMLHLRKCVKCFRVKPKTSSQLMGNLPPQRINKASIPAQLKLKLRGIEATQHIKATLQSLYA